MTRWMDFGDIMLSKLSQTEKVKYCMISLLHDLKGKLQKTES